MQLRDLNIVARTPLSSPASIREEYPITEKIENTVATARGTIARILSGEDKRFLVVVGPCSIHDKEAALEYAAKLQEVSEKLGDKLAIVMRVYFEKPRTSVGWKGFINDPDLDDSFNIEKGLREARKLMLAISDIGLAIGTEALDPISPQYLDDLVAWSAIGARTVESQTHREMASGLSSPVGLKNGTDGNIDVMVNALKAVDQPHAFLGVNKDGRSAVFQTKGNAHAHGILRGGAAGPNYDADSIAQCIAKLEAGGLHSRVMIDCSHGNSNKDFKRQGDVLRAVTEQRVAGNESICGVMIESNLNEGQQSLSSELAYGVSITDGCIGWDETEELLTHLHSVL